MNQRPSDKAIRVLLVDDQLLMLEGIKICLRDAQDIKVVGEAASGAEAVTAAEKVKPSVVVMDIAMPQMNGFEAARLMRRSAPNIRILILSVHNSREYIEAVIRSGASGFVLKNRAGQELAPAIRAIHAGREFFSFGVAERDNQGFVLKEPKVSSSEPLSGREQSIICMVAEGKCNKDIAWSLDVSVRTVEKHRQIIMKKLNVHSVAALTRYAMSKGLAQW